MLVNFNYLENVMKIEMNEAGGIDITDLTIDQVVNLMESLKASPEQAFLEDQELRKMFKLLAILQSEVFQDMESGKIDFSRFKQTE